MAQNSPLEYGRVLGWFQSHHPDAMAQWTALVVVDVNRYANAAGYVMSESVRVRRVHHA